MRHLAPYAHGSETSREAARRITEHMPELRHRVWVAIELAGADGLVDAETCERTGLGENTVRPRRGELVAAGLVVDSGRKRIPRTEKADAEKDPRPATIWVTVENAPKHAHTPQKHAEPMVAPLAASPPRAPSVANRGTGHGSEALNSLANGALSNAESKQKSFDEFMQKWGKK